MTNVDSVVQISLGAALSAAGIWHTWEKYFSPWVKHRKQAALEDDEWVCSIMVADDDNISDDNSMSMKIFYASQTGTGESFARELTKQARKFGFNGVLVNIESADLEELVSEELIVFIVSTYGEGDPTDGTKNFYDRLKCNVGDGKRYLDDTSFAVFGCGNKQYEFFNKIAKDYDKFLESIGGQRIIDVGLGDDDRNIEDDWINWKALFWNHVLPKYKGRSVVIDKFECAYTTSWMDKGKNGRLPSARRMQCTSRAAVESSRIIKVKAVRQLRQNLNDGSTIHVDFHLGDVDIMWQTADNLNLVAPNDAVEVSALIERLGLDSEAKFALKHVDVHDSTPLPLPGCISVRNAFTWQLDIHSSPKKRFIREIANFCEDEDEKKVLLNLGETMEERYDEYWTLLKVLNHFPSLNPPLHALCEFLPKLRPRAYTISSSSLVDPKLVSIAVKLVVHKARDNSYFWGVASKYVSQLGPGQECRVFVTPSNFRVPRNTEQPVVMIGHGVGLAPYRAIIQEADEIISRGRSIPGEWELYYGCRYRDGDFIYKEDLERSLCTKNGCLDSLYLAFSRESSNKVYVQDLVRSNGCQMYRQIIENNARIMVCGGTAMGKSVREALQSILCEFGYMSPQQAKALLEGWLSTGRYVQEFWA